jgi:low affinity Fe/Cu permease
MATTHDVVQPEDVEHPPPPVQDRLAARAADKAATIWFLLANLLWWAVWLPTEGFGADTSGQFNILTLLLSFEAIVLTIAVLIQNRLDAQMRDRQAEADVKNNAISAEESVKARAQLDRIERALNSSAGNGSGR